MSPEQSTGSDQVDGRSDTYSLGCVLFEMLAGEPPFTGPSAQSVAAKHLRQTPPSLETVRPNVPDRVLQAVRRALEKVPADRFQRAQDFARALTIEEPRTRRTIANLPSTRWLVTGGLAALLLLAVVLVVSLRGSVSGRSQLGVVIIPFSESPGGRTVGKA